MKKDWVFDAETCMAVSAKIGDCHACVNYNPDTRNCALLDIWFEDDGAEQEGECEYYQPDPQNN